MSTLKCADCQRYLFQQPMQCPCGDRLCGSCYQRYKSSNRSKMICPLCQTDFLLEECFRDRAATMELRKAILKCDSPGCPWEGKSDKYEEHIQVCQFCKNDSKERKEMDTHTTSTVCPHQVTDSAEVAARPVIATAEVNVAARPAIATTFLSQDETQLLQSKAAVLVPQPSTEYVAAHWYPHVTARCKEAQISDNTQLSVTCCNTGGGECVPKMVQVTCYNGVYVWKIPEVQRHSDEAAMGGTVSLYSPPFYTSPHGYKLCLRLYMGSGKSSHLSFFLTVMKGEYDALLKWPFKQTVTLMLLDQDKLKDIVQSFRPEPSSSSFQRPRNEMNVASGCPMFAPLSVLNNSSYVKDDTMFLKCKIDTAGIDTD